MNIRYTIFTILSCFFLSCKEDVEIIELTNLNNYYNNGTAKIVFFVISSPPKNNDILLNLVNEHFLSFAPVDTIKKYVYYNHDYYKETRFTPRGYREAWKGYFNHDYITDHKKDKLITITIETSHNIQKVIFYEKEDREIEIISQWKENTKKTNH